MPTIADFNVLEAGTHTFSANLLTPAAPKDYVFSAPAVDAGSRSILLFRLHPEGATDSDGTIEMRLNGILIFARTLSPGIERSLHVAIPRGLVEASDNLLHLSLGAVHGLAFLTYSVSELILFFQAAIA